MKIELQKEYTDGQEMQNAEWGCCLLLIVLVARSV